MKKEKKVVLVVDDDPGYTKAIQRVLKDAGYETITADNGFEAGTQISHFNPDLIILDLKMPEMDGKQVLECIRSTDYLKHHKILVISGLAEETLKEMVNKGADDYLAKPFENADLLAKTSKLLE